jgi:Flp pilus assembly protein TadD
MAGDPEVNAYDLAVALKEAGSLEDAARVAAEARAAVLKDHGPGTRDEKGFYPLLGQLCVIAGKTDEARAYLNKALTALADDPQAFGDLAGLYAQLGEAGPAVELLRKSLEQGSADPFFPVILPDFLPIRKSPEFRALFKLGN